MDLRSRFAHRCLTVPLLLSLLVHCGLYLVFTDGNFSHKHPVENPFVLSLQIKTGAAPGAKHAIASVQRSATKVMAQAPTPSGALDLDSQVVDQKQKGAEITKPLLAAATKTPLDRVQNPQTEDSSAAPASTPRKKEDTTSPCPEVIQSSLTSTKTSATETAHSLQTLPIGESLGSDHDVVLANFGEADGPRLESMPPLRYPQRAMRLRREGCVLLLLEIDSLGELVKVSLQERAGFGFDEVALAAVSMARFHPAERNGQPVACRAVLPVTFRL